MEDYIFIIIALILSVFGAINKKKKKQNENGSESYSSDGNSRSVFEELFDDTLFGSSKATDNTVPPPYETEIYERPKAEYRSEKVHRSEMKAPPKMEAPSKMDYQPLTREGQKHSYVQPKRENKVLTLEKLDNEKSQSSVKTNRILNDFSLKKAVVYSEILTRKY